jgi:hypothetical protein
MNEACSALEIEFKRVSNDLEYVSHGLETEFRSRCVHVVCRSVRFTLVLGVCHAVITGDIDVES